MRVAVFTNQFPARLNTFFARDIRALIDCGLQVDVFPFYPPDPSCWPMVPTLLGPDVLPRDRVRHIAGAQLARALRPWPPRRAAAFLRDSARIVGSAARYGIAPVAKSAYAAGYAWASASRFGGPPRYDHVLAYWGNYAASAAWLFHRQTQPGVPFSMFVHARMDLYRQPAFLAQKLLYADNIFVVCEFNRRYLETHYPAIYPQIADRIHVHHLGVPLDDVAFEPAPRPPAQLLAVGNLEPLKGFAGLIEALDRLRSRGIAARLDIIGQGEQEKELRQLVERLALGDVVTFRGLLPSDAVLAAMRGATILVHPPISPDAMPTVIKEAMAVGTPVIASDLAGIPEMLDDGRCGVLVPPGDGAALTEAIAALLGDAERRRRLADAGRRHMERHFDQRTNGAELARRLTATVRQERLHDCA